LDSYHAIIDYTDISDVNLLNIINESAMEVENSFIKTAYKYDYFIQIDLTALNGLTLKSTTPSTLGSSIKNKIPIANLFIKVKIIFYLNISTVLS
jgi:hypothetical protein